MDKAYDVYLSYRSSDRESVEAVARAIRDSGLSVFLDAWRLQPGAPWQDELQEGLQASSTTAVFVGTGGIAAWQAEEVALAVDMAVRTENDHRVIPVLLPGAPDAIVRDGFIGSRTWVDFRGGVTLGSQMDRLIAAVRGEPFDEELDEDPPNPYMGLRPFTEQDADRYYGRALQVADLVHSIQTHRFAALAGPSGSGKTSILRAGVIHELTAAPSTTHCVYMSPGADPLWSLARAVAETGPHDTSLAHIDTVRQALADEVGDPDADALWKVLAASQPQQRDVVLVVDQLEELFTRGEVSARDRRGRNDRFSRLLLSVARRGPERIKLVVAIRADFIGSALEHEALAKLLKAHLQLLEPLGVEDLRSIIINPARQVGVLCERGLPDLILRDLANASTPLPLLQAALESMWNARRGKWLTIEAYHAVGGVTGALTQRAESTFLQLPAESRNAAKSLFLSLVSVHEGQPDASRSVQTEDYLQTPAFREVARHVLDAMSAERLITVNGAIEIAHESMFWAWDRLAGWIAEARHLLRLRRHVTDAMAAWQRAGESKDYLLSASRLRDLAPLTSEGGHVILAADEARYLELSDENVNAQRRRTRRLRNILTAVLAAAALISTFSFLAARSSAREASAREFAASAVANMDDPQLAMLLATHALEQSTTSAAGIGALHEAIQRNRLVERHVGAGIVAGTTDSLGPDDIAAFATGSGRLVMTGDGQTFDVLDLGDDGTLTAVRSFEADLASARIATAISDDGQTVAAAIGVEGGGGRLHLWDVGTGTLLAVHDLDRGFPNKAEFSRSADWLAVSMNQGGSDVVYVRNMATGDVREIHEMQPNYVDMERGADDSSILLLSSRDGTVTRLSLPTGEASTVVDPEPNLPAISLAVSNDGERIAIAAQDGSAYVFPFDSDSPVQVLHEHSGAARAISFSPDDTKLTTGGDDGAIRVYDVASGRPETVVGGHSSNVRQARWSAEATRIVSVDQSYTVHVNDVSIAAGGEGWATAIGPSGVTAIVPLGDDYLVTTRSRGQAGQLVLIDGQSGSVVQRYGPQAGNGVGVHPEGLVIAVQTDAPDPGGDFATGAVALVDTTSGAQVLTLDGVCATEQFRAFPRQRRTVGEECDEPPDEPAPAEASPGVEFSSDGRLVAVGGSAVSVSDGTSGRLLALRADMGDDNTIGGFIRDDTALVVQAAGGGVAGVFILDAATLETVAGPFPTNGFPTAGALTSDGRFFAGATQGGDVTIFDLEADDPVRAVVGHDGAVSAVSWSPSSELLATAGRDGLIKIWTADGRTVDTIPSIGAVINALAFTPEGDIVVGDRSGGVYVVVTDVEGLIEAADARLLRDFTDQECERYFGEGCPSAN